MIDADADPTGIGGQVVDAVWHRPAKLLDQEVLHSDLLGITLWPPFPASIPEVAYKLFFFVSTDHRLLLGQGAADAHIDVGKLRIAIRVAVTLAGLAVGLEAEFLAAEQFANHGVTDFMPHGAQFSGQAA